MALSVGSQALDTDRRRSSTGAVWRAGDTGAVPGAAGGAGGKARRVRGEARREKLPDILIDAWGMRARIMTVRREYDMRAEAV